MGPDSRLRLRIAILVALGALVVAGGVALLLRNTTHLRAASQSATASDRYLLRAVEVERLIVDAETGLRGYLVTGETSFLAPLRSAEAELPAAYAALALSAASAHAFTDQAATLIAASRRYISGYVAGEIARAARDLNSARTLALTQQGKTDVDAIRAISASLQSAVANRQTQRQGAARASANDSITEAIVLLVLLTALTLALGTFLGRLAVQRERARELAEQTVLTLQRSILPERLPEVAGCELAIRFLPAAGGVVSGDFYDVYALAAGRWAIVIGDVCGKGASAAAVSAMARWTLRSHVGPDPRPADALRWLNTAMRRHSLDARYVTLSFMVITVDALRAHVALASAGHPAPIHLPAAGEPAAIGGGGDVLGVWDDVRVQESELVLAPGDTLVAFTDGVTDQGPDAGRSPEAALRVRPRNADAGQVADLLVDLARETPGGQRDDIAILAVRFVGSAFTALNSTVDVAAPLLV